MENANSHDYLHKIKTAVIDNIRRTGKPSVEAFLETPATAMLRGLESDDEDEEDDLEADMYPEKRMTQRQRDEQIEHSGEHYEPSDDEEYKEGLGVRRQPGVKRRRNIMDFQNPNAAQEDDDGRPLNGESSGNGHLASPAPGQDGNSRASSARPTNGAGARSNGTSSRARTPAVPADEDGDIDMDEPELDDRSVGEEDEAPAGEAVTAILVDPTGAAIGPIPEAAPSRSRSPAGVVTPPESPPAPAGNEVEMDEAEDDGDDEPSNDIKTETGAS
jgi:histone deacetylase 1/2